MNILQLLFDPTTGRDSFGPSLDLRIDSVTAARLATEHYIDDVRTKVCNRQNNSPKNRDNTLFVAFENGWLSLEAQWFESLRFCRAESASTASAVTLLLQDRLSRITRWHYDMHICTLAVDSVSNLLELAQQIIGFALILFDESFNLVGYALGDTMVTAAFRETIEKGYAAGVPEDHQREYRQHVSEHREGFETVLQEAERDTSVWVQPFQTIQGKTYFLHVMLGHANCFGMRALATATANELRNLFEQQVSASVHSTGSGFLAELVTSRFSERQARQRADFLGLNVTGPYVLLRAEPFETSHPDSQLEELCGSMRHLMPDLHAAVIDHGVVGMVKIGDNTPEAFLLRSNVLKDTLVNENMCMVISDSVQRLSDARFVYDSLRKALEVMWHRRDALSRDEPVMAYDRCRYALLLDALQSTADNHDVIPRSLQKVRQYDATHGSDFERTLITLIENRMNKTATCALLNIHRSTLDYRIERLEDHFGIDLADHEITSHVFLLSLIDVCGSQLLRIDD